MSGVPPTAAAQLGDLDYHVDRVASEIFEQYPVHEEGTIIGGSYDPTTGDAAILDGATYSIIPDDPQPLGDSMVNREKLPQLTWAPGFQYGPTGVERAITLPTPDGPAILYRHFTDDSPQAPAGETWMLHKTVATQTKPNAEYDAGHKLTNDGPTAGDGLGGTHMGHQGALTKAVTKSGHQVTLNDTAQTITVETASAKLSSIYNDTNQQIQTQAANGLFTLWDGQGNAISHVVPSGGVVALGALPAALSTTNNAVTRFTDLNSTVTKQVTQLIGNAFIGFLTSVSNNGGTFGSLTPGALLAALASNGFGVPGGGFFPLLPSLNGITVPACSQTVLAK